MEYSEADRAPQVQKEDHFQEEIPLVGLAYSLGRGLRRRVWRISRGSRRILRMPSRKAGSILLGRRALVSTFNRDPLASIGVLDACSGMGTVSLVTRVALKMATVRQLK